MSLTREIIVKGAQDGRWSHSSGQDILDLWDRFKDSEAERDAMLDAMWKAKEALEAHAACHEQGHSPCACVEGRTAVAALSKFLPEGP
jgi:hypothetical protein